MKHSPQMYEELFRGVKVSQVFIDPASKEAFLIFKSTQDQRAETEDQIASAIESIVISKIALSHGVVHLFNSPESKQPQFSFLQSAQFLYDSIIMKSEEFDDDQLPGISKRLKLQLERGRNYKYKQFVVISISLEKHESFKKYMEQEIQYLEKYKIQLLDQQTNNTKLNWKKVQDTLGIGLYKSEEAKSFEKRFGVFIYLLLGDQNRILIYGKYLAQKVASSQLLILFSQSSLEKCSIQITQRAFSLLQGNRLKKIETKFNELIPGCKINLMSSHQNQCYVVIYGQNLCSHQLLKEIYKKLESDVLSNLEAIRLPSSYWENQDEILKTLLKHEMPIIVESNSSQQRTEVKVHSGRTPGLWIRSHQSKGATVFEHYKADIQGGLEQAFIKGHSFIARDDSSFTIKPGKENIWSEVDSTKQCRIKRIGMENTIKQQKIQEIRSREQLLIGFKQELTEFQESLLPRIQKREKSDESYPIWLSSNQQIDLKVYQKLELKFRVKLILDHQLNTVMIQGILHQQALKNLENYIKSSAKEEFNRSTQNMKNLFLSKWKGAHQPQNIKIECIYSGNISNYMRQKCIAMKKKSKEQIELLLFQEEGTKCSHYFFQDLSFLEPKANSEYTILVHRILIGSRLKVKEQREFIVPPKQSKNSKLQIKSQNINSMHYDLVQYKQDNSRRFMAFNSHHVLPLYRISFTLQP